MEAPSFSSFPDIDPSQPPRSNSLHDTHARARPHNAHPRKKHRDEEVKTLAVGVKGKGVLPTSKDYFLDSHGDRDALRYGNSSSHVAPRYHRDGGGTVLGTRAGLRIVSSKDRTERGLEIAPKGKPYMSRYSSRQAESSTSHLRRLVIRPQDSSEAFDAQAGYIVLDGHRKRIEKDELPSYRTMSREDEDDDTVAMEEALGSLATVEQDIRRRTTEIGRYLQLHPEDVDTWITYSNLHLKLSPNIASTTDPTQQPQTRANAEVTLSILSRALEAHPSNMVSAKLHLKYLEAAEAFWPTDKVATRYRNVLRELGRGLDGSSIDQQGLMSIWLGYIDWRSGVGVGNGVDEVVDVYINCLAETRKIQDRQTREENQVYLLLRACLFMKIAGFTERALAIMQAMMETTFFKPVHLRPPTVPQSDWYDHVATAFETFWDSEQPRIGEEGAKGWKDSQDNGIPASRPIDTLDNTVLDPFEKWLQAERHAEKHSAMPARATNLDPADEDDPYRVVLFADIQPFLFPIQSPEVRLQLIYAFLNFLGLPFDPPEVPTTSPASLDPHLTWSVGLNDIRLNSFWPARTTVKRIPWQTVGGEAMEPEQPRGPATPFATPTKSWAQDRSSLLAGSGKWFQDVRLADLGIVDLTLARNAMHLLRALVPDPTFTLALLALESAVSPKASVKLAKSILSANRDNLLLWDGYARLERQRGNVAVARGVYVAALQAALADQSKHVPEDEADLWAAWAEMEFFEGEESRSLQVLVMASGSDREQLGFHIEGVQLRDERVVKVENDVEMLVLVLAMRLTRRTAACVDPTRSSEQPSAISMLKTKQHYSKQRSTDLAALSNQALFVYITDGVEAARHHIMRIITQLPPGDYATETTYQLLIRLLYHHTSRHASPASLARDILELATSTFPNNTMFLSMYLWGEMGGRVHGRIQRLIAHLLQEGTIVGSLWSVWAEAAQCGAGLWAEGSGGAERVRTALSKAINTKSGKQSIALWKLYIQFEIRMKRFSKAKELCYRAVSAIGGCKDLYLQPFSTDLRPHFTDRELQGWADLMTERGIRVRIGHELFWEAVEEDLVEDLPEDEGLEDDELAFLQDRQKLKPY